MPQRSREGAQQKYPEELRFSHLQARALFLSGAQPRALAMLEGMIEDGP